MSERRLRTVGTPGSDHRIEPAGKTMGIVGMGGIGVSLARRAHYGFDMRVVATDTTPLPKPEYVAELREAEWFPEMVPQVDVPVGAGIGKRRSHLPRRSGAHNLEPRRQRNTGEGT